MKNRDLLLGLCLAGLAFNASAYYRISNAMKDLGSNPESTPFVYSYDGSTNPIVADAVNNKFQCRSFNGSNYDQTLRYLRKDADGNVWVDEDDEPIEPNNWTKLAKTSAADEPGGTNLAKGKFKADATSGIFVTTSVIDGTIVMRYVYATDLRPIGRDFTGMTAKVVAAPKDAASSSIKLTLAMAPSQYTVYYDQSKEVREEKQLHYAFMDFGPLQPVATVQEVSTVGELYNEPEALFSQKVKYVDFIFENVKVGDKIGIQAFEAELGHQDDPSWLWTIPSVKAGNADGSDYITSIQAEDFDEPWVNGHVAHSPMTSGNRNDMASMRRYPEDHTIAIGTVDYCYRHFGAAYPDLATWDGQLHRWLSWAQRGVLENMHVHDDWSAYKGEYIDETSNLVTPQQAMDNFGGWFEYTFDAEEDMDLDLFFRTNTNFDAYNIIMSNGSSSFGKSREEGGYVVEGMENEDWIKKYGHSLRVWIDGVPMRTNWAARPVFTPGMTQQEYADVIKDYSKWTNTQETDDDGNLLNSYVLYRFPAPNNMQSEMAEVNDLIQNGHIEMDAAPAEIVGTRANASTTYPDFKGLTIPQGRHTIKVQSLGGQWHFDDMKLAARPKTWDTPTSIQGVDVDEPLSIESSDDAPVEFFNLQGVKVVNPKGGIFIRRQGNKVTKVVIR